MSKVLIYCPSPIGKSIAGPAIRSWEIAKGLSKQHEVTLISLGNVELQTENFENVSFANCREKFQNADILIAQRLTVPLFSLCSSHGTKVIIDAYDPSPLELLEYYKKEETGESQKKIASEVTTLAYSLQLADGIVCASEKQRDLWLGFLLAQKLITPSLYDRDPTLREFIDVVPFGLSSMQPKKNGKGLREKLGISKEAKVLLWGGGIWNWFDPLSLIKAMAIVAETRPDIKLVFMGMKAPDPKLPPMAMAREAQRLSRSLKLIDRSVFFHQEWVPYDERQNFLLDADVGVSTHFAHLETCFSFRTRILDYLWAELPMIVTTGDSFAELIERQELGEVVPCQDERALAHAILELLSDRDRLIQIKRNIRKIREQFFWKAALVPLQNMIGRLSGRQPQVTGWRAKKALMSFLIAKFREKGLVHCIQKALRL